MAALTPVNLPSKNTLRTSQYFFYSDLELKADNPLFAELGDLRDQVVRELQLPQANTIIQVYLFEDRDKYDRFMKIRYPDLPKVAQTPGTARSFPRGRKRRQQQRSQDDDDGNHHQQFDKREAMRPATQSRTGV